MYIAIKKNKTNMKIKFFRKTRNEKLFICNGWKAIYNVFIYEMDIATKTNEINTKNLFKKLNVVVMEK